MIDVSIMNEPPFGIASRAFVARFMNTCSSWPASAKMVNVTLCQDQMDLNILADDPHQELFHLVEYLVQVNRLPVNDLLAAEGKKTLGERGGPVR